MTVNNTTNRVLFTCNGAQVEFPFEFKIYEAADLEVILRTIATGAELTLTLTTDYTVSITAEEVGEGGTVTLAGSYALSPPSADYKLLVRRVLEFTQEVPFRDGDKSPASRNAEVADRAVMLAQQVYEIVLRSLALKASSAYSRLTLDDPEDGKLLRWKSDLSGIENVNAADVNLAAVSALMEAAISKSTIAEVLTAMGLDTSLATFALPDSTTISAFAKTFLDDVDAATVAATLEVVAKALFGANTILAADLDNTPAAVTVDEQRIVGRVTSGNIAALTAAQVRTILGTAPFVLGSDADGDMYYRASSLLARLAKGTANYKLFMNAGATAPEWAKGLTQSEYTRDISTASGDQTLTGAGHTPSAAIILFGINDVAIGLGLSNGTINYCITYDAAYDNDPQFSATLCIDVYSAATHRAYATLAFNSDGGVLTWTKVNSPTGTLLFTVLWIR